MKKIIISAFLLSGIIGYGQNKDAFGKTEHTFSKQDSLFGSNTKYRDFWDVKKYDIEAEPNFAQKSVKGSNRISFTITRDVKNPTFQIDIQQPMKTSNVMSDFEISSQKREGNFLFIQAAGSFKKGDEHFISLDFEGNPVIAIRAPWDGGWVFTKDANGKPWMTTATEDIGTSVWLPIKDYWGDEPDNGVTFTLTSPKDLVGVSNGRLVDQRTENGKNVSVWEVKNPINDYSITPYVGNYVHFGDTFDGEKGKLSLDYYVIKENLDKAKKQFEQVKPMLKAFEYWFGPYPFYEDGYKLVETPHLGMEHQSAVAYGNKYQNGYLGRDLSGTGVGKKFDFIIIHESGHEWFANNITAQDTADMWIHESFTCYSETLYADYVFGKEDGNTYLIGQRHNIQNDVPIIPAFGVRAHGSGDMYYKGASMLHTIRQVINDDEKFRQILRGLGKEFYHQTVTGKQIQDYINQKSGIDFSSVFTQYLTTVTIPKLEYKQDGKKLSFRWTNTVKAFNLPVRLKNSKTVITPSDEWKTIKLKDKAPVEWDANYYIEYTKAD
ncbi:M1 family metallopeptidase [Elizabethkingia meningoseptica]|uniref:M1 family metallopeptidase n=1 Tax=Elizabethkingia meningoseptica TaxID=238 RepID=UPI0023AF2B91|nr:M1 family metallopeptidase [Elizabethkingia meningoseptica]MDE5437705.1 M1 family metallopeptidase [Elizabethkingia meningoseptica]MDE5507262.1 M1 family metallopeptidase [Elizabethkingia meningoseptica]MDE5515455.1 M1 family metallopeptidase [Elizabethkingia meningoseptica]MDE5529722.1 M1 family metallopeptidase [Elizabethkingia meningoseptica]MDE5533278.1 M1 family metallopeptidase [Elizabethkingia meningoseptica]